MRYRGLTWMLAPMHAAALLTAAKSFRDNPLLGHPRLNAAGLHVARVRLAERLSRWRRRRLRHLVSAAEAADFARDGFVVKPDFLPPEVFAALRDSLLSLAAPAREMRQGDAVTRRIPLDAAVLARAPLLRTLVEDRRWLGLIRYVASSALTPMTYVQTIFARAGAGASDPQLRLHSDTFHATVKAWFFLTDVAADAGPFTYVPGSHRLTPARLAWLRRMSREARGASDSETQEGSFRIAESELAALGLPPPRRFAVPANTLVVADTMGFHARGASARPSVRIEIWAYGRRNPFLPWTGLDPLGLPLVRGRAVRLYWALRDLAERLRLGRNPWRPAGTVAPGDPLDRRQAAGGAMTAG